MFDLIHHFDIIFNIISFFCFMSDISGIVYVKYDDDKNWKKEIISELQEHLIIEKEVFVDEYEGTALGGPNDLCFLPNGDLLFTDPVRRPLPDPAISPVYKVTPAGKVSAFANELAFPNGIAVSEDHSSVYVSESRAQRLVSFTIDENGYLLDQQLVRRFRDPGNPDGLAVDVEGNILQSLPGIRAIAYLKNDGTLIDLYHLPDWVPANLAFGGDDMRTVFVCGMAQNSVYQFRHPAAGVRLL